MSEKLIAQMRERLNAGLGIRAADMLALVDALEAAEVEVEKAHAAMAHWLGEANRLEAELADLRIENQQLREAYGE